VFIAGVNDIGNKLSPVSIIVGNNKTSDNLSWVSLTPAMKQLQLACISKNSNPAASQPNTKKHLLLNVSENFHKNLKRSGGN
jgi:hypothetical protein